jgi:hypothetical protein
VFVKDFLEINANTCSRKLLVVAKESENIQPGGAELEGKGLNVLTRNFILCGASPQGGMFLQTSSTQPVLGCLVSSLDNF